MAIEELTTNVVTDGGQDEVSFTTDGGANVTVTAESGQLFVNVQSPEISINRTSAVVDIYKSKDVLNCGTHSIEGNREVILIPIEEHKCQIEQLREDSKDDSPLTYEVEEYTKTSSAGGWGRQEITKQRLVPSKSISEMSDRERKLSILVNTDRIPSDAEPSDVLTFEDLLDDARTTEEREQDALSEAAETGKEVVISTVTTHCNAPSKECDIDHVTRVATPDGDVETRRIHTY
ncbi:hypothetical protein [Halorubrum sp. DTA98]|uniref:hypothetical protein n=1 Tax=Halorubrum sp. DTA98 TaxID=3402163 RepID=UPI003AB006A5